MELLRFGMVALRESSICCPMEVVTVIHNGSRWQSPQSLPLGCSSDKTIAHGCGRSCRHIDNVFKVKRVRACVVIEAVRNWRWLIRRRDKVFATSRLLLPLLALQGDFQNLRLSRLGQGREIWKARRVVRRENMVQSGSCRLPSNQSRLSLTSGQA